MEPHPNTSASGAVRAGLHASIASILWTLLVGGASVVAGVLAGSLSLAAFGAVGLLDAAGSITLVVHFRHALRHEAVSSRHEELALRVVTLGMAGVGLAVASLSVKRLVAYAMVPSTGAGIVLAGCSVPVLTLLGLRKRRVAARILSHALLADSWLSAAGAALGALTLLGSALERAFGWWWLDPIAATFVALGALVLSWVLARGERAALDAEG